MEMGGQWAALPAMPPRHMSHPVLVTSLPLGGAFVEQVEWPLVTCLFEESV